MSRTGRGGHSGVLVASPVFFSESSSFTGARWSSHFRTASTLPAATAACSGSTVNAVAGVTGGACSAKSSLSCEKCELFALLPPGLSSIGVVGFEGMFMCKFRCGKLPT
jgi:hypothetical protein